MIQQRACSSPFWDIGSFEASIQGRHISGLVKGSGDTYQSLVSQIHSSAITLWPVSLYQWHPKGICWEFTKQIHLLLATAFPISLPVYPGSLSSFSPALISQCKACGWNTRPVPAQPASLTESPAQGSPMEDASSCLHDTGNVFLECRSMKVSLGLFYTLRCGKC